VYSHYRVFVIGNASSDLLGLFQGVRFLFQ